MGSTWQGLKTNQMTCLARIIHGAVVAGAGGICLPWLEARLAIAELAAGQGGVGVCISLTIHPPFQAVLHEICATRHLHTSA